MLKQEMQNLRGGDTIVLLLPPSYTYVPRILQFKGWVKTPENWGRSPAERLALCYDGRAEKNLLVKTKTLLTPAYVPVTDAWCSTKK